MPRGPVRTAPKSTAQRQREAGLDALARISYVPAKPRVPGLVIEPSLRGYRPRGRAARNRSKAQQRLFFARGDRDPRWRAWAHARAQRGAAYRALPERKRPPTLRTLR